MTKIIGFVCEWGGYAAADLAGFRRIQYPSCLRTIRVECTGRIDPVWLVDALVEGAEGVIIIGCTEGDSRHEIGNFRAHERIRWVRKGLAMIGERPERVRAVFLSSEDAEGFAATIRALATELESYGPVMRDVAARERLEALREVLTIERVRWLIGRTPDIVSDGDVFGAPVTAEAFDAKVEEVLRSEYRSVRILRSLRSEARSVADVASTLSLSSREVMSEITDLIGLGRVEIAGHADPPVFKEVSR
jgi:F420-non-reducing hydrogenase iron-sulfur subunit